MAATVQIPAEHVERVRYHVLEPVERVSEALKDVFATGHPTDHRENIEWALGTLQAINDAMEQLSWEREAEEGRILTADRES